MHGKWFLCLCLVAVLAGVIVSSVEKVWAVAGLDDIGLEKGDTKAKAVITAERPSKLKIAVGVGSVVVAILVLKFL